MQHIWYNAKTLLKILAYAIRSNLRVAERMVKDIVCSYIIYKIDP